jgi:putative transposase
MIIFFTYHAPAKEIHMTMLFCESFMKTLKSNEADLKNYQTTLHVLENIPRFIEEIYTKKRVHGSLGCISPEK